MHLIIELLYTIYPFILSVVIAPLFLFVFVLEKIFKTQNEVFTFLGVAFVYTFFPALGVIFISQGIFSVLQRQWHLTPIATRKWWVIFGLIVLVSHVIGFFIWAFPNSVLANAFVEAQVFMGIWLCLAVIGFGAGCFYLIRLILNSIFSHIKKLQNNPTRTNGLLTVLVVLASYPFLLLALILIEVFATPYSNPQASRFAQVHAAIKNTCFIDPRRDHCPQTLEEISYIEPKAYREMMEGRQVYYLYYPEQNLYTLVVRYSPVKAVVFDWRFMEEHGIDFQEYEINLLGKDRLKNPPEWDGPWEFEEWDYSQ